MTPAAQRRRELFGEVTRTAVKADSTVKPVISAPATITTVA